MVGVAADSQPIRYGYFPVLYIRSICVHSLETGYGNDSKNYTGTKNGLKKFQNFMIFHFRFGLNFNA